MPPLPDTVSILLRSSPTAAMAALLLISTSHRGLLDWFSRTVCSEDSVESEPGFKPKARRVRKSNGSGHKPRNGDSRLAARDEADEQLIEAMKASPGASIGELSAAIERSRTTTVTALHRLRAGGVAESVDKVWRLVEPEAPREPPERWIEPLSAAREHRAHA